MHIDPVERISELDAARVGRESHSMTTCRQLFGDGNCREDMPAGTTGGEKDAARRRHRGSSAPTRLRVSANRNPMHSPIAISEEPP